jgi:hypothetical protein
LILGLRDPEGAKNLAGENVLRLIQIRLTTPSFEKISLARQDNSPQARIPDSSSINAVNVSSARVAKRFPLLRIALELHLSTR